MIVGALPLLADAADVITFIVVIVIFLFSAVGKLISKMNNPQKPAPGRPAGGRPAGPRPRPKGIEDEIGDFLRRAAQRRGAQGQQRPGAQGPGAQGPGPAPPRQPAQQPVRAEVIVERPPRGDDVSEHTRVYLDRSKFDREADGLGHGVTDAEKAMKARVSHDLTHQIGTLSREDDDLGDLEHEVSDEDLFKLPATAAAGLAPLFSDANSIRQAILINEILQRPTDRW